MIVVPKYACNLSLVVNFATDILAKLDFDHDMWLNTDEGLRVCCMETSWPKLRKWGGGWEWASLW